MNFAPEFALALECCRRNFSSAAAQPLHIPAELSWPSFLRLVRFHCIQGLAWAVLAGEELPQQAASELSSDAKMIAASNLKSAAECIRLQSSFKQAGVDLLFVKGLSLSVIAYRDPFIKMSSDIDILIEADAVEAAARILRDNEFRPLAPPDASLIQILRWHAGNKESAWINRDNHIVELHTRLADNDRLIPDIGMQSPRQDVEIGSGKALPTLATDELIAYLFVHGACSAWYRLKWIADVGAILHRMDAHEIDHVYHRARAMGAGRAAAQALLLAERLFGLELGAALRQEILGDPMNRILANIALRKMQNTEEPTDVLGGTAVFHLTRPFLLEGWAFPMNELSRQLRDIARRRLLFR